MPPELGILFVASKSTKKFQKVFRIAARCKFRPKRPISGNFHSISYSFIERNCLKTNLEKSCKRKLFVLAVVKFYKTECSMERKLRWFWPFFAPYLKMEAIPDEFLLQIFGNWSISSFSSCFIPIAIFDLKSQHRKEEKKEHEERSKWNTRVNEKKYLRKKKIPLLLSRISFTSRRFLLASLQSRSSLWKVNVEKKRKKSAKKDQNETRV